MSNEAFNKFLLKLFEKTAVKDQLSYFNIYEIGKEIGIFDESEINRIVKILHTDGFVANKELSRSGLLSGAPMSILRGAAG